ncbi:MAG: M48 family metalloprotease [Pseudomonadota bacterium]
MKLVLALSFVPTLALAILLTFDRTGALDGYELQVVCILQAKLYDIPRMFTLCPLEEVLPVIAALALASMVLALVAFVSFTLLARYCGTDAGRNARWFPRLVPWAMVVTALTTFLQGSLICLMAWLILYSVTTLSWFMMFVLVWFVVLVSTLLVVRSLRALSETPPVAEDAITVSRTDAPALWRMIDEIAARLGSGLPATVLIGMTGAFWVASRVVYTPGREEPDVHVGRVLYLSLPLMHRLERDQLAAIIAHELAHFREGDVAYTTQLSPTYHALEQAEQAFDELEMPFEKIPHIGPFFGWMFRVPAMTCLTLLVRSFQLNIKAIERAREFRADQAELTVVPPEVSAMTLVRLCLYGRRLQALLW